MVDKYITEENVKSHFECKFTPEKIDSHLTNIIVYDLETHSKDRARAYNMTFYHLSKLSGKHGRDLTPDEIERCENDTLVLDGDNCVGNA